MHVGHMCKTEICKTVCMQDTNIHAKHVRYDKYKRNYITKRTEITQKGKKDNRYKVHFVYKS